MAELKGLVTQEIARVVTRRRVWLLWFAFALVGIGWMLLNRTSVFALPGGRVKPTGPMLALGAIDALGGLVLFSPLLLGGTLGEDRTTGLSSSCWLAAVREFRG